MPKNYIEEIRAILAMDQMSQQELAARLGVTFAALNRWLNGHAKPHPRRIHQIQRLYQEVVGYPAITKSEINRLVVQAKRCRRKAIWDNIARNTSLQDELLLEHTYNSTNIEGTTFTKRQTEAVIFGKTIVPEKTLAEHLEVTNHAAVLRTIFEKKYDGQIDGTLFQDLHRRLMTGLRQGAGEYSRFHRAVRGLDIALTHPDDITEEMAGLERWWKKAPQDSLLTIADFHVSFELIHPFGDGNGRVARLIMVLQCLRAGYPPIIIENTKKAEYYDVLAYAQEKSSGPFVDFLYREMQATLAILKKHRGSSADE